MTNESKWCAEMVCKIQDFLQALLHRHGTEIVEPALSPERQDCLRSVALEDILDAVDLHAPSLRWWASSFRRRYVDFRLPDDPTASRDPLGPVAGRSFGATAAIARAGQTASEPGESPGMA